MRRSWVEQVMGLPVSVLLRGPSAREPRHEPAVHRVYDELRAVEAVFSTWLPDSEVSRLNAGQLDLACCSSEVREVAELCEQARVDTRGCFDARRPDGSWDPSGLVKGWAVERACRHLAGLPLDWCVNAGGDVLVASRTGEPFGVGIADPRDPTGVLAVVPVANGAVATSGTAARGAHLWDPRTGLPAAELLSVTVLGRSLVEVDALATAAFVGGLRLLAGSAGAEPMAALAVHLDGRIETTAVWPDGTLQNSPAEVRR